MAAITDWVEDFEGTNGTDVTTSNTVADTISGGTSVASQFSTTGAVVGSTSMRIQVTGTNRILEFDSSAQGLAYFDVYLNVATAPAATTMVMNWWSDATKVGDLSLVYASSTTFQFRLRDNATARWTSATYGVGQYRIGIKVDPGSSTGHRLKIYQGANIDTASPVEDSGNQTATASGASTINNLRLGVMTNTSATLYFDDLLADDAAEPTRGSVMSATTLPWKVRVSGAWVSPTVKTRVGGAWV